MHPRTQLVGPRPPERAVDAWLQHPDISTREVQPRVSRPSSHRTTSSAQWAHHKCQTFTTTPHWGYATTTPHWGDANNSPLPGIGGMQPPPTLGSLARPAIGPPHLHNGHTTSAKPSPPPLIGGTQPLPLIGGMPTTHHYPALGGCNHHPHWGFKHSTHAGHIPICLLGKAPATTVSNQLPTRLLGALGHAGAACPERWHNEH
jgi:hypothetical protein